MPVECQAEPNAVKMKLTEVMHVKRTMQMEVMEGREAQELTMNTMNTTIPREAPPRTPQIPVILLQTRPNLLLHQHDLRKRTVAQT